MPFLCFFLHCFGIRLLTTLIEVIIGIIAAVGEVLALRCCSCFCVSYFGDRGEHQLAVVR